MKNSHPFFIIGTTGTIVTALLHMLLAFLLPGPSVHLSFYITYPVFVAFLIIGSAQQVKPKRINPLRLLLKIIEANSLYM